MAMISTDIRYGLDPFCDQITNAGHMVATIGQTLNAGCVRKFEEAWADYCGAPYCLCCASGESALEIAAHALELRQVAVQANTLPATVRGLLAGMVGNEPDRLRLVDVDAEDGTIKSLGVPQWGSELVPVMLYGRQEWTLKGGEMLIDACQAHGMKHPQHIPAQGNVMAIAWSFYPTKNLGGITDGGAVTFSKVYHYNRAVSYAKSIGYKGRMNELNAAVLLAKLPFLDEWNLARRQIGLRYHEAIRSIKGVKQPLHPLATNGHLYPVLVENRDDVVEAMLKAGVQVGWHYPQTVAAAMNLATPAGSIMGSVRWCECVLTLPIYPGMPNEDVDRVVEALANAVA